MRGIGLNTWNRVDRSGRRTSQLAGHSYILDAAGHRLNVTELSGRVVNYSYDDLYRLTNETIASDPSGINGAVNYTYDAVGNRKQMTSTLAPVPAGLWNYAANDRFMAGDSYDANGNLSRPSTPELCRIEMLLTKGNAGIECPKRHIVA